MRLVKTNNYRMNVPEVEYFTAGEDIAAGSICYFSNGKLMRSSSRVTPTEAFAMNGASKDEEIAVCLLTPDQVWEVESWASVAENLQLQDGVRVDFVSDKIYAPGNQATILHANGATPGKGTCLVKFNCRKDET